MYPCVYLTGTYYFLGKLSYFFDFFTFLSTNAVKTAYTPSEITCALKESKNRRLGVFLLQIN